jgi:hypothetical protein
LRVARLENGIGEELEKGRELGVGRRISVACGVDELLEILDPGLAADGAVLPMMGDEPALLDDARDLLVERRSSGFCIERVDELETPRALGLRAPAAPAPL